jgi:hypothetical protein
LQEEKGEKKVQTSSPTLLLLAAGLVLIKILREEKGDKNYPLLNMHHSFKSLSWTAGLGEGFRVR